MSKSKRSRAWRSGLGASWDAWGKRRLADGADGTPGNLVALTGPRGFTGHEHLDTHGLVHMNGRMYEPSLGRFVNADPLVQAPLDARSWNRYTYVMNNPLAYTDPTGYSWWTKWRRPILAIAASFLIGPEAYNWAMGNLVNSFGGAMAINGSQFAIAQVGANAFAGAASGFAAGGIMGGNLNSALQGAVSGTLSGGTAGYFGDNYNLARVAAESVVGGTTSAISGGEFRNGFRLAGMMSLLTHSNYMMREEMVAQSRLQGWNGDGKSKGFFGDHFKLAGARRTLDDSGSVLRCDSFAGGCQGARMLAEDGASRLGPFEYGPGSILDRLAESFAGPHDWLRNTTGAYRANGNAINSTGVLGFLDNFVANAALLVPASPFAAAALGWTTPGFAAAYVAGRSHGH
ncbi:MAG: RHS repeat-associated core domain-containing protein [Burkholderiales bacterium]|nr:RHS repeat-associated core domain-containing protein [Burkholderiales bacterium]